MPLREIIDDEDSVRIALVVGCDYIRIIVREILFPDAFHVTKDMGEEKESVLCNDIPEPAFGRVLLVELTMMLGMRCFVFRSVLCSRRRIVRFYLRHSRPLYVY